MQFTCTCCGRRYVINGPVLPDRAYNLPCKVCGTLLTIKRSEVPRAAKEPPAREAGSSLTQAGPGSPPPLPPATAPQYIDLFEGEDLSALRTDPAPGRARRTAGAEGRQIGFRSPRGASAAAPAPARPALASEADPFAATVSAAFEQPEPPLPALPPPPASPERPRESTPEVPRPATGPRKRSGTPLAMGLAAAAAFVLTLLLVALVRPWAPASGERSSQPREGAEAALPVAPSPAPSRPAAAGAEPTPTGPVAVGATPADDAGRPARLAEQTQAQSEKLEKDRLAREEKDRLALEEKVRLKAERAEKDRARRDRLAQPKGAKKVAATATARVALVPSPPQPPTPPATGPAPVVNEGPARPSVPASPAGGPLVAVEFSGVRSSRGGGEISDTVYSQNPNDAKITDRSFANGLVTVTGQVGYGRGSSYAGIGLNVNVRPGREAIDASRFTAIGVELAGSGVRTLRIRLIGSESETRSNGCYPIALQRVSEDVKKHVLKRSDFAPEGWCGSKGRSASQALKELVGFEVADVTIDQTPVSFSVGTIVLIP